MVCIYCGATTQVVNSRTQKRSNQVWRRRHCVACDSIFTTQEAPDLAGSLRVQTTRGTLVPFVHNKLFLSIYESCKHRSGALDDATAITDLVIAKIVASPHKGLVAKVEIAKVAHAVLTHFDRTAGTIYAAYHLAPEY